MRKYKHVSLWMFVLTINAVIGTAIGVTVFNFNEKEGNKITPPFVLLSQQVLKEQNSEVFKKIEVFEQKTDVRFNVLEDRVEQLERHPLFSSQPKKEH